MMILTLLLSFTFEAAPDGVGRCCPETYRIKGTLY
jgi:hypothetical protein